MPSVVRSIGDLKHAKNVDGQEVYRREYLDFQGKPTKCLNTDTHFMYKSKRIGSSVLCTCGGQGVTVGYHAYKEFSSYIGNEVLACYYFIKSGRHADGSS